VLVIPQSSGPQHTRKAATMDDIAAPAGVAATALFALGYLPMLLRALRTRDLVSYSRANLVLSNVGNALQTCYVLSLPMGPIWLLHSVNVAVWALMLGLHMRHGSAGSAGPSCTTARGTSGSPGHSSGPDGPTPDPHRRTGRVPEAAGPSRDSILSKAVSRNRRRAAPVSASRAGARPGPPPDDWIPPACAGCC